MVPVPFLTDPLNNGELLLSVFYYKLILRVWRTAHSLLSHHYASRMRVTE